MHRLATTLALLLSVFCVAVGAQEAGTRAGAKISRPDRDQSGESERLRLNTEVIRTLTAYRESLEQVLGIQERDLRRLSEQVGEWRSFYEKGYVSRVELQERERALARARADLERTHSQVEEARVAITEAEAREEILKQASLPAGAYTETSTLIRYAGAGKWSHAFAKTIERFFVETFGRALPVSALGQTALHDRMRLDHRDAMDVAVHPDSAEGRALMDYLQRERLPFIAFRNRLSRAATGAHIHIGEPSPRMPME